MTIFTNDPYDGYACINDELVNKTCAEMTDEELAAFIEQGAWRRNAYRSDESAEHEAARRGNIALRSEEKAGS